MDLTPRLAGLGLAALFLLPMAAAAPENSALELVSVHRVWNGATYNSFGDILRFHHTWYVTVREGRFHASRPALEGGPPIEDDGRIRILRSPDGDTWTSCGLLEEKGVDLRDPKISATADGRLMIVMGGSYFPKGVYAGRRPRVAFSADGTTWTQPTPVLREGDWLWRVTWHEGRAYGVAKYGSANAEDPSNPRRQDLVVSDDGVHWKKIVELGIPGGDESTVRFLGDGRMVILMRTHPRLASAQDIAVAEAREARAVIGVSSAPYTSWQWHPTTSFIGGPNFIVLPDGRMVAGGRWFPHPTRESARTAIGFMTLRGYEPSLVLPSGGDSSYPGFALHDGLLWVLYYSAHEKPGGTELYLAKVKVAEENRLAVFHPGLQLWSIRPELQRDPAAALDLVRRWGMTEVETADTGVPPIPVLADLLRARNLRAVSAHFGYQHLTNDLEGAIRDARTLGVEFAICSSARPAKGAFDAAYAHRTAAQFNAWGRAFQKAGIRFGYHAHGVEFGRVRPGSDETPFDVLVRETDPNLVCYEMDVFWVVHAGQDPVALLDRYPGRWQLLHLKDLRRGAPVGTQDGKAPIGDFVAMGQGSIDWPKVLWRAASEGVEHFLIEDESAEPLKNIPISLRYLETGVLDRGDVEEMRRGL